jgi:translation initiation factor 3 subunit L
VTEFVSRPICFRRRRWIMFSQSDEWAVPDAVRTFVNSLYRAITEANLVAIADLYAIHYFKVTERFFKASPWPNADLIGDLVDHDPVFLVLYRELYFRHLCNNRDCFPTLQDRLDAYHNYLALFTTVLAQSDSDPALQLPSFWIWDIIHEFVAQKFAFDEAVGGADRDQLAVLAANPGAWSLPTILQYLHAIVEKGRVPLRLNPVVTATDAGDKGVGIANFVRSMSYQALVALSLVNPPKKSVFIF